MNGSDIFTGVGAYLKVNNLIKFFMTTKKTPVAKAKKVSIKVAPARNLKKQKRVLVCANGEQCFWTNDGKIISNLVELRDTFEHMADEVFAHHVNKSKNDFADWIHYVLGDTELAKKLRGAKKPASARTMVVTHLKMYDI